jgi:ZIP family zinc transporter
MFFGASHGLLVTYVIVSLGLGLTRENDAALTRENDATTSECSASFLGEVEELEAMEANGLRVELLQKQTQLRTNISRLHKKGSAGSPAGAANIEHANLLQSRIASVREKYIHQRRLQSKRTTASHQKGERMNIGLLNVFRSKLGKAATMMTYKNTLAFLAIPAIVLLASSLLSVCHIPLSVQGGMQHFASGVVLSAMTIELVPVILEPSAPMLPVCGGFVLGIAFFVSLHNALGHRHARALGNGHENPFVDKATEYIQYGIREATVPWATIIPTLADFMSDGVLAGLSFGIGARAGVMIVLAIALEMASVGPAVFTRMKSWRVATGTAIGVMLFLAACLYGTGVIAFAYAAELYGTALFYLLMAFACSACLWLAFEDLVMMAHESGDEKWLVTVLFFIGFFGPMALEKL